MSRLRKLRLEGGYTMSDITKGTGIPQPNLSAIENGRRKLGINNARKLAKFFNVSIDYLLGESKQTVAHFEQDLDVLINSYFDAISNIALRERYDNQKNERVILLFNLIERSLDLSNSNLISVLEFIDILNKRKEGKK